MKLVSIIVIAILAIGVILTGYFFMQESNKLGEAESKINALETSVSTLQQNVSSLQTRLTQSEATVSALQTNLNKANTDMLYLKEDLKNQQGVNSTLSAELKKIKYPRHFATLSELTDWLQKDDTNAKYPNVTPLERAFILEVKAAMDGFLLPIRLPLGGTTDYVGNSALIARTIYVVRPADDYVEKWYDVQALPTHPIPPQ